MTFLSEHKLLSRHATNICNMYSFPMWMCYAWLWLRMWLLHYLHIENCWEHIVFVPNLFEQNAYTYARFFCIQEKEFKAYFRFNLYEFTAILIKCNHCCFLTNTMREQTFRMACLIQCLCQQSILHIWLELDGVKTLVRCALAFYRNSVLKAMNAEKTHNNRISSNWI